MSDSRTQSLFAGGSAASTAPKVSTIDGPSASTSPSQAALSASGEVFKRKRGRPPKYNVLDVNVNPSTHIGQSPEILLTSFKLAKGAAGLPSATGQVQPQPQGPVERQQHSPSSQSRRGRPRTVSSPRHASEEMANTVNQTAAAAVALLQQQQAHHLQQQLELLRMWNSSLDSVPAPVPSSPMAETKGDQPSTKRLQFEGFTTYVASENCPDTLCRYRGQHHYHCRLPRCFYSSNRGDQLESHHREFHDAFEIPDGYACYDRWYNCRHTSCQYNGQARHFHCQKAGCSAALLKFNELQVHTSKGHEALSHDQQFGSPAQVGAKAIFLSVHPPIRTFDFLSEFRVARSRSHQQRQFEDQHQQQPFSPNYRNFLSEHRWKSDIDECHWWRLIIRPLRLAIVDVTIRLIAESSDIRRLSPKSIARIRLHECRRSTRRWSW